MSTPDLNIPDVVIEPVKYANKVFNLVQDSYLPAGTKQRGWKFFRDIKLHGFTEVVTYGTVYGYGQVATAWCCQQLGLKCTLFLPYTRPTTYMTQLALSYGAVVRDIVGNSGFVSTTVLKEHAEKYAGLFVNHRKFVKLGLDDPLFIASLASGIRDGWNHTYPQRIWLAGGSGVLARALAKAFPGVKLFLVQVGREIYPDILAGIDCQKYVSRQPFRQETRVVPPYNSLLHYDAKVWQFVKNFGLSGDYIWNVK